MFNGNTISVTKRLPVSIAVLLLIFAFNTAFSISPVKVTLWHAYRGDEKKAIEKVAEMFNLSHSQIQVELAAVPFDAMSDKLSATIPLGNGPDIFIGGHNGVGHWAETGLILPLENFFQASEISQFIPETITAFRYAYPEGLWGIPANFKNLALFYNKSLIQKPPANMEELLEIAKKFSNPRSGQFGKYGLVYETGNFYYHAALLHGFGGTILKSIGRRADMTFIYLPLFYTSPMVKSCQFLSRKMIGSGACPDNPDRTLITQLFNTGNAMFNINGQWFRGEIDPRINYGVAPMPIIRETGLRAAPFLTAEGYYMTSCARNQTAAVEVIRYFSGAAAAKIFARVGKQTPAHLRAYDYAEVANDPITQAFVESSKEAIHAPNCPEMAMVWSYGGMLLGKITKEEAGQACLSVQKTVLDEMRKNGIPESTLSPYEKTTSYIPLDEK